MCTQSMLLKMHLLSEPLVLKIFLFTERLLIRIIATFHIISKRFHFFLHRAKNIVISGKTLNTGIIRLASTSTGILTLFGGLLRIYRSQIKIRRQHNLLEYIKMVQGMIKDKTQSYILIVYFIQIKQRRTWFIYKYIKVHSAGLGLSTSTPATQIAGESPSNTPSFENQHGEGLFDLPLVVVALADTMQIEQNFKDRKLTESAKVLWVIFS